MPNSKRIPTSKMYSMLTPIRKDHYQGIRKVVDHFVGKFHCGTIGNMGLIIRLSPSYDDCWPV